MRFYLPRNPCPPSPRRPSFFLRLPPKKVEFFKFPPTFLLFSFCPFVKIPVFDNSSPATTFPLGRFPTQPRINDSIYTMGLPPVEERLRGFRAEPSQAPKHWGIPVSGNYDPPLPVGQVGQTARRSPSVEGVPQSFICGCA